MLGGGPLSSFSVSSAPDVAVGGGVTTYTGTLGIASQPATFAASASHTAPVYTGTVALTSAAATFAAAAAHTAPVYTGTVTLNSQAAAFAASASHTAPVYTGTMGLTSGVAVFSAAATFTAPVYTGTLGLTSGSATFAASASFTAPVYTGTMSLASQPAVLAVVATFGEVFIGVLTLTGASATFAAAASVTPPVYTGTLALASGVAAFSASAAFTAPVYTGTLSLVSGSAAFAAAGSAVGPTVTGTLNLESAPAVLSMAAAYSDSAPVPGGDGDFWSPLDQAIVRVYSETAVGRVFRRLEGIVAQDPTKGLTLYITRSEEKTLGVDFSREGAVRDGAVLSDPEVDISVHPEETGTAPVVTAGPDIVPAAEVFTDADGRKIRGGRGARVRVSAQAATPARYVLSCRVRATTPGQAGYDILEGGGILVVE